jgi:hypothetical protein
MEPEPLNPAATNLVAAIPRLAARAAKMAFLDPDELTAKSLVKLSGWRAVGKIN